MTPPAVVKRREPKPCPRCYAPMRPTADGGFACERHGVPPPEQPSRVTGWAPHTETLHRQAKRKLASSRDVWNTTIQELDQPAGGLDTVGVGT